MADGLHHRRAALGGQLRDQARTFVAIGRRYPDFDQLVLFQCGVDFGDHRGADAFAADLPQRLEPMRLSAQETGLDSGQGGGHGRSGAGHGSVQGIMPANSHI